jgi:hypothetical protein
MGERKLANILLSIQADMARDFAFSLHCNIGKLRSNVRLEFPVGFRFQFQVLSAFFVQVGTFFDDGHHPGHHVLWSS